jgi:hypothetical protein
VVVVMLAVASFDDGRPPERPAAMPEPPAGAKPPSPRAKNCAALGAGV